MARLFCGLPETLYLQTWALRLRSLSICALCIAPDLCSWGTLWVWRIRLYEPSHGLGVTDMLRGECLCFSWGILVGVLGFCSALGIQHCWCDPFQHVFVLLSSKISFSHWGCLGNSRESKEAGPSCPQQWACTILAKRPGGERIWPGLRGKGPAKGKIHSGVRPEQNVAETSSALLPWSHGEGRCSSSSFSWKLYTQAMAVWSTPSY